MRGGSRQATGPGARCPVATAARAYSHAFTWPSGSPAILGNPPPAESTAGSAVPADSVRRLLPPGPRSLPFKSQNGVSFRRQTPGTRSDESPGSTATGRRRVPTSWSPAGGQASPRKLPPATLGPARSCAARVPRPRRRSPGPMTHGPPPRRISSPGVTCNTAKAGQQGGWEGRNLWSRRAPCAPRTAATARFCRTVIPAPNGFPATKRHGMMAKAAGHRQIVRVSGAAGNLGLQGVRAGVKRGKAARKLRGVRIGLIGGRNDRHDRESLRRRGQRCAAQAGSQRTHQRGDHGA